MGHWVPMTQWVIGIQRGLGLTQPLVTDPTKLRTKLCTKLRIECTQYNGLLCSSRSASKQNGPKNCVHLRLVGSPPGTLEIATVRT